MTHASLAQMLEAVARGQSRKLAEATPITTELRPRPLGQGGEGPSSPHGYLQSAFRSLGTCKRCGGSGIVTIPRGVRTCPEPHE